ncbi:MAG TPA: hypothetical protein VMN60_06155 [Longimicrobiales bacterium]|nr:hypothetical protein [Longimicrobiales bacterium]
MHGHIDLQELLDPPAGLLSCPHCQSTAVKRWGTIGGRRRFRCRGCRRTFNPHTGTPLAYVRDPDSWQQYVHLMNAGVTLRQAAAGLDIHLSTAFRRRHALLSALRARPAPPLRGPVEIREAHFVVSRKGSRDIEEPRRRGVEPWHHDPVDRICVVLVVSRDDGAVRTFQSYRFVFGVALRCFLSVHIPPCARVLSRCSDFGSTPSVSAIAQLHARGIRWSPPELAAADHYEKQFRSWLRPFRGVATRYLSHYLAWHRRVVGDMGSCATPASPWRFANIEWREALDLRSSADEKRALCSIPLRPLPPPILPLPAPVPPPVQPPVQPTDPRV